jgi:hypothetical protein
MRTEAAAVHGVADRVEAAHDVFGVPDGRLLIKEPGDDAGRLGA